MKKLHDFRLAEILSKNVFMFRALGINTPSDFVDMALSAFTSSSDETKFGVKFFEPIVEKVSGGKLTDTLGMDIVIERPKEHIVIAIKSGPKWGNSDAWKSVARHFASAERSYNTHAHRKTFVGVVGQCYGRKNANPTNERPFYVLSGQRFWAFLTSDSDFYQKLLQSIGRIAAAHKNEYDDMLKQTKSRMLLELNQAYCTADGLLDWESLAQQNSASE